MRAAAYARYSSDNQREESIDAQLRAIYDFAAASGHTVIREFVDEARSATTDRRPGFQAMISAAKQGAFDVLIVHKLDRFSRDRYDSAFYKRELKKAGVKLISVLERLDGSPESVVLESVLEGMSEYYSKNLAREVMKGMCETAYLCKHTGGKPPYGYRVKPDKTYEIEPEESEIVLTIFRMYASGSSYSDIIDAIPTARTQRGKAFGKNSFSDMLRNEKYRGVFIFNRTQRKDTDGRRNTHKSKPDDEVIRVAGGIPAIVTPELWDAVQRRLADNKRNAAGKAKQIYVLSGKLFCGDCGAAFVGRTNRYLCGERNRTKGCTMPSIGKVRVESMVINAVYDAVVEHAEEYAGKLITLQQRVERDGKKAEVKVQRELTAIAAKVANITNAIASGAYHPAMNAELERLQRQEAELKSFRAAHIRFSKEQFFEFVQTFRDVKGATDEVKRRFVRTFVDRVTIYRDKIQIDILGESHTNGVAPPPPNDP